jgi:bacterioferritin-associated ferredoxin
MQVLMYACICRAIPESEVRRAGAAGVLTPEALIAAFRLDAPRCCGRCRADIGRFVALAREGALEVLPVLPVGVRSTASPSPVWQPALA